MSTRTHPSADGGKISDPVQAEVLPVGGKLLLTSRQLAFKLGVSLRLIEKWSSAGIIPKLVISPRMTRYQLHKVLAALERYETATLR